MSAPAYDIYLGDKELPVGYKCSIVADSAPQVAPRFSSGQQGQTDLDLLKSASLDNLAGGMFQRTHVDSTKSARAVGYFNQFDENFYPTVPTASASGSANWNSGVVGAKAESEAYSFSAVSYTSSNLKYNIINKVVANTVTSITPPAALTGIAGVVIGGMCLHKGYLYVAAAGDSTLYSAANNHRFNISGATWQDITGNLALFFTLRGLLYGVSQDGYIWSVTNETAAGAATYTQLARAGGSDAVPTAAVEFNGAGWIAKSDGLYRFDGTTAVRVLTLQATKLTVFNGALYFMVGKWLYSFNGALVQKLQYFTETVFQLSCNSQYLFVQIWSTTSIIDSPKIPSSTGFVRVYAFDGAAFGMIMEKDITVSSGSDSLLVYTGSYLHYVMPLFGGTAWDGVNSYSINLANIFVNTGVTSNSLLDVTTSEADEGYPNVYKSLEIIEPNYSGMINGDVITVKYQLYDGKTWGSWITAGTINYASTSNYLEITDFSNKLYKRVKINVYVSTMTANSTLTLKGVSWRYSLQPRFRFRWTTTIELSGNQQMIDNAGALITDDSNALTNSINKSMKQKTPLFMFTPDYGLVKTQINNSALTFIIPGQFPLYTDPYCEYPLIAVKNNSGTWEILRVSAVSYSSGADETTITVLERNYLSITAAQINANAEVRKCYKVYITRLLRDSAVLDAGTLNEQTTGESQLTRQVVLEVTEV